MFPRAPWVELVAPVGWSIIPGGIGKTRFPLLARTAGVDVPAFLASVGPSLLDRLSFVDVPTLEGTEDGT